MIIVYFLVNYFLLKLEYTKYKSFLSPYFLFSLSYTSIVFFQFILGFFVKTYTFDLTFLLVSFTFQFTFFLISRFSSKIFNSSHHFNIKININSSFLIFSGSLLSIYLIVNFIQQALGLDTIGLIVQETFQDLYSNGFNFYIRVFLIFLLFYYVAGLKRLSMGNLFIILLFLIPNFLTFVKGIILINLIGVFLILINNKVIKLTLNSTIFGLILLLTSFLLVVLIEESIWTLSVDGELFVDSFSKLISYFFAGIQSFISNFNSTLIPIEFPNATFAIFYNPFARLLDLGPIISNIPPFRTTLLLNDLPFADSNVNTYIGTLYLYNGLFFGNLINSVISMIATWLFKIYLSKKDRFYFVLYIFFVTGLTLSWFEYYYLHSFYFYVIILLGFLPILMSRLLKTFGPVV